MLQGSVDDASCYPGIAKMYDSMDDALGVWTSTGVYEDSTFFGQSALFQSWESTSEINSYSYIDDNDWERPSDIDGANFSFWGPYGIRP